MAGVRLAGAVLGRHALVVGAASTAIIGMGSTSSSVSRNEGIFQAWKSSQQPVEAKTSLLKRQETDVLKELKKKTVREPVTGVEFSTRSEEKELKGCGVRLKYGIVPVYAVGLYTPVSLKAQGPDLVSDLLAVSTELRMTLVRKVDREAFIRAIHDSISTRLDLGREANDLDAFVQLCKTHLDPSMPSGSITSLTLEDGAISLSVDGDFKGKVKCPAVLKALLNVYLDAKSVSPSARTSILQGLGREAL